MWTYHQFLRDLQAELYKRLPEVPEGALVLSRGASKMRSSPHAVSAPVWTGAGVVRRRP